MLRSCWRDGSLPPAGSYVIVLDSAPARYATSIMAPNDSPSTADDTESNLADASDDRNDAASTAIVPSRRSVLAAGLAAMSGPSLTGSAAARTPPVVVISEAPDEITTYDTAEFGTTAVSGDAPIDEYDWQFGDGRSATGDSTAHTFEDPGEYEVRVTVTDENGLSDVGSTTVTVIGSDDPSTAAFSTTFTNLSEPDRYEGAVTLQNPGVLDRSTVNRITLDEPAGADGVTSVDGFTEGNDADWIVADDADRASITFEYDESELSWTDDIDAVLYRHTSAEIAIESDDPDATVERSFEVDGPGYAYPEAKTLFFGEHERVETTTDHGPLTLTEPTETAPPDDLEVILQGLEELSAALAVESEQEGINGFVASGNVTNAGFAFSEQFYAREDQTFTRAGSTWLHECAHITDGTPPFDESARWLTEGYANYYAALMPLEIEYGPYETEIFEGTFYGDFRGKMANGVGDEHDLLDYEHVNDNKLDYSYGALVIGSIDREIRANTDGATFEDVFDRLQHVDEPAHEDLLDVVADVANEDVAAQANAWITAEEYAEPWSVRDHEDAFGYDVPEPIVETTLTAVVDGERRPIDGDDPQRISIEDPIHLDVTVTNRGSAGGSVAIDVKENAPSSDRVVAKGDVNVSGNGSATETIAFELDAPGRVSIDTDLGSSGRFDGTPTDNTVETEILAHPSDATLVRETDDTSRDDPATVATDDQLALSSDVIGGNFGMEQVDGDHALEVSVGDDLYLGTIDAAELESGATYEIAYAPSEETQYVEVI